MRLGEAVDVAQLRRELPRARALVAKALPRDAHLEEVDEVNWRSQRASGDDDWRASGSAAEDMSLFSFFLSFFRALLSR